MTGRVCAGWGIRTPVGRNPAVFKTAVIPFRQIRRWWRLLPPNLSAKRVLCHQVKNGGSLLLGNRGDVQAWAFGIQGRLWTWMRSHVGFGAGWPGMVPAIVGAVYRCRIRRREWYSPIGRHGVPPANSSAVMSRRAIARHGVGGGCGAHLMPRHIHGHPADPPYRLSYSRAPSRTPSGIGLLALHSQWHSRLAERIFSVLSRQRSPWPPAKPARGGSNDGRNRWQRKDHLRNRNVAK